jgi:diazepam-binding inhibitor (GABA receptor modulator, acyl-CoA-binding protein)
MRLWAEFRQSERVTASTLLPERPDNDTLLKLCALYEQGRSSDTAGPRPGPGNFIARAKNDAWSAVAGKSKEQAMQQYADLIHSLKD